MRPLICAHLQLWTAVAVLLASCVDAPNLGSRTSAAAPANSPAQVSFLDLALRYGANGP